MRIVFALLALLGLAGIGFGVLTIITHSTGSQGVPFAYETSGGPGSIIAGLMLAAVALYLLAAWPRRS